MCESPPHPYFGSLVITGNEGDRIANSVLREWLHRKQTSLKSGFKGTTSAGYFKERWSFIRLTKLLHKENPLFVLIHLIQLNNMRVVQFSKSIIYLYAGAPLHMYILS